MNRKNLKVKKELHGEAFTKAEMESYVAYKQTQSYAEAGRILHKHRSTVYQQVQSVRNKITEYENLMKFIAEEILELNRQP